MLGEPLVFGPVFLGFFVSTSLAVLLGLFFMTRASRRDHIDISVTTADPHPHLRIGEYNPNPVIVINSLGVVAWENTAARQYISDSWPKDMSLNTDDENSLRAPLKTIAGDQKWFRFNKVKVDDHIAIYAQSADAEVEVEDTRQAFVQTLSKTFAQLSIGLAIFDRNRHLVLFNPALLDLTNVPFDILSKRPSLPSFLDNLRLNGAIPEPKNYAEWRDKLAQLEACTNTGIYSECWTLPSGKTYRMTGRPHPDGAIALMVEDISSEVVSTRRYNQEIMQYRNTIDHLENPFIVFSSEGFVKLKNEKYQTLFAQSDTGSLNQMSVNDCVSAWRDQFGSHETWDGISDFVSRAANREKWQAVIQDNSGKSLVICVSALANRRTLVEFLDQSAALHLDVSTAAE